MREIPIWNADGRDISNAMFLAEGENIQRTAKNVIQGGNLSPYLVSTNKNLLALLKAVVSSAEKVFPIPSVKEDTLLGWCESIYCCSC